MKKIPTIFVRSTEDRSRVTDECNPECLWVFRGEGVATQKFDGTCCRIRFGELFKRYDVKHGKQPPEGFEPAQDPDPVTGHWPGWIKVSETDPADRWHREARRHGEGDGYFELIGPKIQGNPEEYTEHVLVRHGSVRLFDCPRTFDDLRDWLTKRDGVQHPDIEGIVWHHPDGRMAKIKKRDFGLSRKPSTT